MCVCVCVCVLGTGAAISERVFREHSLMRWHLSKDLNKERELVL